MMRAFAMAVGFLVLFAGVAASPLGADPSLVARDDPLYREVRRLALIAGSPPPSRMSPLTRYELLLALERIPAEALSGRALADYRRTREALEDAAAFAGPRASAAVRTTLEGYLHTGDEADEWRYSYPDRAPLLSVPLRVRPLAAVAIEFDLDWRKNYATFPGSSVTTVNPDPFTNIPFDVRETDVQFPFHAVVSLGGPRWSVQAGRARLSAGSGEGGSLVLSDHVEFHDFLMASVYGHLATYRAIYVDLEAWTNASVTADDRMFFLHRIELRPTSWLSLAANDGFIFAGKPIELRYFNPLMVMHSWFVPLYGNSILLFEAAVRPFAGLEVYAHLSIDQLQAGTELDRDYSASEPEALGYLAGVEYTRPFDAGWITVGTEWVFLDPWMYLGRTLLGSFTYRRRVQAENALPEATKVLVEKSLGYPTGPDSWEATVYARADLFERYALAAEAGAGARGENGVGRFLPVTDEADALRETPSGDAPEIVLHGRLAGDALIARFGDEARSRELRAGAVVDLVRIANDDHVAGAVYRDLQLAPYVSFTARW